MDNQPASEERCDGINGRDSEWISEQPLPVSHAELSLPVDELRLSGAALWQLPRAAVLAGSRVLDAGLQQLIAQKLREQEEERTAFLRGMCSGGWVPVGGWGG